MRNLLKKALACTLTAALALSCLLGIPVSAAELAGTAVANAITVDCNADTAVVDVTIGSTASNIAAAIVKVSSTFGKVTSVAVDNTKYDGYIDDTENDIKLADDGSATFIITANDWQQGYASVTAQVTFTANEGITVGTAYPVVVDASTDVDAANWNEDAINFAPTDGSITLKHTEVEIPAVDATCSTAGSTAGSECSVCGDTITASTEIPATGEHAYKYTPNNDGTHSKDCPTCDLYDAATESCTLGDDNVCDYCEYEAVTDPQEPELNSSLNIGRQIYMGEVFGMYYVLPQAEYSSYADFYIEIVSQYYDTNDFNLDTKTERIYKSEKVHEQNGADYYLYAGTTGYELLLNLSATVHCLDANGNEIVYTSTKNDTIAARALRGLTDELAKANPDTDLVTLFVDLANYATEAEKYFATKYPSSDLAKSTAHTNDSFAAYQEYATQTEIVPNNENLTTYPYRGKGVETAKLGRQVTIGASNFIAYNPVVGSNNADELYLTISYTDSYANEHSVTVRYNDLASTDYWYTFDKVAMYDINQKVYANLYADGIETALVSNEYTIETAAATNTDTNSDAIFDALLKLGYAARAYFNFD